MYTAIIAHYLGPRLGIGQYLNRLLPQLVERLKVNGIKFKIIASPNAVEQTPALQELLDNVEILEALDYSPGKRYLWFFSKFSLFCKKLNITSVTWLSNPIVLPWHPKSIAVIHDVNEWKSTSKYGSYIKTVLRAWIYLDSSLNFAKKIILVSQSTYQDLINFRNNQNLKSKLTVIPNGSDSQLTHLSPVYNEIIDQPFLLSVGRIDPASKRLPEAVKLVSEMRAVSGKPWALHLVGGMNETTQKAGEEFLGSIKSLPWAHYHGHVNDRELAGWYRQANAVVFLADSEGFGLPVAEASSFGLWSIVNEVNLACVEAGGDALITIDPYDAKASASCVIEKLGKAENPVKKSLTTWKDASAQYSDEISKLFSNIK